VLNSKWRQWQWMSWSAKKLTLSLVAYKKTVWTIEESFWRKEKLCNSKITKCCSFQFVYMGWVIWTPIFHNTWCIWTGITNICREFDQTKTSKSKFPGVCQGGMSRFRFDSRIINIDIPFAEHNFGPLRRMLILIFMMN
jgi:hypothetical protein